MSNITLLGWTIRGNPLNDPEAEILPGCQPFNPNNNPLTKKISDLILG
jgi:hypothetical protein